MQKKPDLLILKEIINIFNINTIFLCFLLINRQTTHIYYITTHMCDYVNNYASIIMYIVM